jgi:hypothetical protein
MGNILTTVIGYDQTDVYVFKDTNEIVTTLCRIKILEVESIPISPSNDWVITSSANAFNAAKYDVTIEYKPNNILSDFTLLNYDENNILNNTKIATFTVLSFINNNDNVLVTPSISDLSFTVKAINTSMIIVRTDEFDNAIFRVINTDTEIYGYVRNNQEEDVAVTQNKLTLTIPENSSISFNAQDRFEITSITLVPGRWVITGSGSFKCPADSEIHFWFDIGGVLNELTLQSQFASSIRTFQGNSDNMLITMHSEFFFDEPTKIYWCTTPDVLEDLNNQPIDYSFTNSLTTSNPFVAHALSQTDGINNNAKLTAISLSSV